MNNWLAQFFRYLAHLAESGKMVDILKGYQAIAVMIFTAVVIPAFVYITKALRNSLRWWRNARALRSREGSELYTRERILKATKYFLEPDCQSVDPSGGENFRKVYSTREPAFRAIDKLLNSGSEEKFTFVLGDSGMGKTTFLLNYYARNYRRKKPPFQLFLVPLGTQGADRIIDSIKSRSEAVLFLDAFDEDPLAIEDHRKRLLSILDRTSDFQHVLFTSRTQFFAKADEIPRETGLMRVGHTKAGQTKEYLFNKLYLSPFNTEQVQMYLRIRFPIWKIVQRRKASSIARQVPDLTARPMLLAHIPELLNADVPLRLSVQIYEAMIEAWLIREMPFVDDPEKLRLFSEDLAVEIYSKIKERGADRIPPDEALDFASRRGIKLKGWQLRNRSLLNRDADGNLKFAHRTFMEYLFSARFLKDANTAAGQVWTDQIKRFWWEAIICLHLGIAGRPTERKSAGQIQTLIDFGAERGDLRELEFLSLPRLELLSSGRSHHPEIESLKAYCKQVAEFDEPTGTWSKRIPGLFQSITVSEPGFQGKSTKVVVDFAAGLMWQSLCSHLISINEAAESVRAVVERPIGGLPGWRLPTLAEAVSLLPLNPDSSGGTSQSSLPGLFDRWSDAIWTTDTATQQSHHVVFMSRGRDLAYPEGHASVRLVRTM